MRDRDLYSTKRNSVGVLKGTNGVIHFGNEEKVITIRWCMKNLSGRWAYSVPLKFLLPWEFLI